MTARRKRIIFISGGAGLVFTAVIVIIIILNQPQVVEASIQASGEAEAVMVTRVKALDGIWDVKRYSDELYLPIGITISDGGLIVADSMCDRIQIIEGEKNTRIGKPGQYGLSYLDSGALIDGYRENALFTKPSDVSLYPNGDLLVADTGNHAIRKIDDEIVITIAGNGTAGYANGMESEAQFNSPRSAVVGTDGIIYVADTMNHCIRRIDPEGNVTLYAGTPGQAGYRDGAISGAMFYEPSGLFLSPEGVLYIADAANHSIRKIENGTVTTIAGAPGETDTSGYPAGGYLDGEVGLARFNFPRDITLLENGAVIVADTMNHSIRMIKDGAVITLAGGGQSGQYYSSSENLQLTRPEGVCTDGETLYISDTANNRVVALPLTERLLTGRPSRAKMLEDTGIATDSKYAYKGDIRVFINGESLDIGRVPPWNTAECIYMPIRPLFEALGATVAVDENAGLLSITVGEDVTMLTLNQDYFILKGVAVTTMDEIIRLFPYTVEWFSEFSMIAIQIPPDLLPEGGMS